MTKKDKLIKHLIEYGNVLDKQTVDLLLKIDKNIDFNQFKINKTPLKILYFDKNFESFLKTYNIKKNMTHLNLDNCRIMNVFSPFKFKLIDDDKLYTDVNIFFRNIKKINYFEEINIRKFYNMKTNEKIYFRVKYYDIKQNKKLKSFRFIMHSVTKQATNLFNEKKYFVDGYEISEQEFKVSSRDIKIKSILEKN